MRTLRGTILALIAVATLTPSFAGAVEQLHRSGRWVVDAEGRVVLLHGVNAVWKLAPYAPPDEPRGFQAADAAWLRDHGLNAVRLGVLFAGVMPSAGVVDSSYLVQVDRVVQLLAAQGIWVLLDFHQDMYNERFHGEGFPDWAVDDDGLPHPLDLGFPGNYFTPECMRTFDNFWANKNGIWDRYRDAWKAVATKWKDQPYLMGYDLMNEPWPGTDLPTCANPIGCPLHDTLKLQAMQEHVLAGIREVDPANVVWFEPNVIFNSGAQSQLGTLRPIAPEANLGLSWHDYCLHGGVLQSVGIENAPLCEQLHRLDFDNAEIVTARIGAAGLVTEFGATDDLSVLESITRLADEYLVGWMYWHYKNWGDPTTVSGETGAQGLFSQDSDLTTLKSAKADLLVRPYPQATAGIPLQLAFDPQTKVFVYRYAPRPATAPTEIFVPDRHYPNGYDVTVEGATVSEQTAQRVLLLNVCGAREVNVVIRPR
jgi:endoglycosylceramidase